MIFSNTPEPPYVAAIFTTLLRAEAAEYDEVAERMLALAKTQPGFLGAESARDAAGVGITVSYWRDEDAAVTWKQHVEHASIQERGKREWYRGYRLRIARVMRDAAFDRDR